MSIKPAHTRTLSPGARKPFLAMIFSASAKVSSTVDLKSNMTGYTYPTKAIRRYATSDGVRAMMGTSGCTRWLVSSLLNCYTIAFVAYLEFGNTHGHQTRIGEDNNGSCLGLASSRHHTLCNGLVECKCWCLQTICFMAC